MAKIVFRSQLLGEDLDYGSVRWRVIADGGTIVPDLALRMKEPRKCECGARAVFSRVCRFRFCMLTKLKSSGRVFEKWRFLISAVGKCVTVRERRFKNYPASANLPDLVRPDYHHHSNPNTANRYLLQAANRSATM
jgi:hypothetical protein